MFSAAVVIFFVASVAVLRVQCECDEGHFRCNSSDICVAQRKNCDQKNDCPDGSDEWNCADRIGDQFWDHIFRKRPGAENDEDCKCHWNYTGVCSCKGGNIVCQHLALTQVPQNLPQEARIDLLDLTGNSFMELTAETLGRVTSVRTLVLRHCAIKQVHPAAFHNIPTLHTLYMDHNHLEELPEGLFPKDNKLKVLVLSGNNIRHLADGVFAELKQLKELDLRDNALETVAKVVLQPMTSLYTLYLNGNRIRRLGPDIFPTLPLRVLSLADNRLRSIEPGAFTNIASLQSLYLSGNNIDRISNDTFRNLRQLLALNLNENNIKTFDLDAFHHLHNLTSLYLTGNSFKKLDRRVLQHLVNLQYVYFDEFSLCKAARHVRVCEPKGDGISSQHHLLDNPLLRGSVWVMGVFAVVGNVLVLLGRLLAREPNAVHSLYIRNLALSDLLMGVYLFLIAAADHRYRDFYIDHEDTWRHSAQCNFCGFLSTLSCESSVLILSLVTWDRLVSVTRPLARLQQSRGAALVHISTLWLIATAVAAAPLIAPANNYFGDEFYGSNGVCLSLHIHDPFAKGWEYSAAMFVLLNALALAFIIFAYSRMLREIRSSGVALRSTQESQERAVAKRFGVIVLTDCLCWVPVILVKLAALSGVHISEGLYAWLAVLVLPINSALNPVLYTLTTSMFKQQIRKMLSSCPCKQPTDAPQSGFESALSLSLGTFPPGDSRRRLLTHRNTQSSFSTRQSWKRVPTAV